LNKTAAIREPSKIQRGRGAFIPPSVIFFRAFAARIHGKTDWRAKEKLKEYIKVTKFGPGWEDIIKKYEINWIIFDTDSALSRFLKERDDWKLIYTDKVASIFVRNVPEYFEIIQKYQKPHSPG
jgi:hypothetical protein